MRQQFWLSFEWFIWHDAVGSLTKSKMHHTNQYALYYWRIEEVNESGREVNSRKFVTQRKWNHEVLFVRKDFPFRITYKYIFF